MTNKSEAAGAGSRTIAGAAVGSSTTNKNPSTTPSQRAFLGLALSMSWQLAVVVVVPILGGHALDDHFHTLPWLTLTGLVVALLGMTGVLLRAVSLANDLTKEPHA